MTPDEVKALSDEELRVKVKLIQCGRHSCGHILLEDERDWKPLTEWSGKRAICPKCGEDSFYTLNEKGQKTTMSQRDQYRDGIDPATIEPSSRMGLKMRRRILAAKRRAMEGAK